MTERDNLSRKIMKIEREKDCMIFDKQQLEK